MKRNVVRLEIAKLLEDLLDSELAIKRANVILAKMEKLGMKPPEIFRIRRGPGVYLDTTVENSWELEGE